MCLNSPTGVNGPQLTNKIALRSDSHGVPVERDIGRPVREAFMVLARQDYISAEKKVANLHFKQTNMR